MDYIGKEARIFEKIEKLVVHEENSRQKDKSFSWLSKVHNGVKKITDVERYQRDLTVSFWISVMGVEVHNNSSTL